MSQEKTTTYGMDNLTLAELRDVIDEAQDMIQKKQQAEIRKAYIDVLQIASRVNLGIDELIAWGRKDHRKRGSNV